MSRVDPEAVTQEDSDTALYCAWQNDHVATIGVLAEVVDASKEMRKVSTFSLDSTFKSKFRTSEIWPMVEKEQDRRLQREVVAKLDKLASRQDELASVVNMIAMKVGLILP